MNTSSPHADLIAAFKRAQADAEHKSALIQTVANKGPKAMQAAVETAARAAKRSDAFAKKLAALGVGKTQAPPQGAPAEPMGGGPPPI